MKEKNLSADEIERILISNRDDIIDNVIHEIKKTANRSSERNR